MARHSSLFARVARYERQKAPRRFPRMVCRVFDAEPFCEGMSDPTGVIVRREPGEPLVALHERARGILGSPVAMWEVYSREFMDREEELPASAFTRPEPEPEPEPVDNWSDLAGIGRQATREELERWGVIAIPPERLM